MLEGDLKRPFGFVGRSKELTRLKQEWLPRGKSPVALIQGLAGMGKTMLAAEVIHLWHDRFDYVFAFQSRPYQISAEEFSAEKFSAEEFYRDLDLRLSMASKLYREKCRDDEYRKICLPTEEITGEQRYETMRNNLADALHSERILLVADNFETHLLGDGACKDLEWKNLLDVFCNRLGNSGSCVLITSRHVPADLKDQGVWIPMGPLPLNQARLLIQNHDGLRGLWHNKDTRSVALRVLEISRGHPLILQRLGILAGDAGNLVQILDRLEKKGLKELPDLPDMVLGAKTDKERETEREYLEDVAVGAVDVLLERIGSDARLMLWVTTLAFEPVQAGLLVDIWENLVNESPASGPLLNELVESGLLQKQGQGKDAVYSFHELVRERMAEWMENHPQEQAGQDAKQVWLAYGQRYEAIFWALQQSGESGSREAATEMGRRALTYVVRAGAYDELGSFAGELVISTRNPRQLQAIIAELQRIVEQVPQGETRWSVRTYLADALGRSDQPEQSLSFYEQSANEAESARNWSDVGWICQNWAIAFTISGRLVQAREVYMRSANAKRKGDMPEINIIGSELEAFRIDVMQGKAKETLPEIEDRLDKIRDWWERHGKGETIAEVPDAELLARVFIGGLDIAEDATRVLENWLDCLNLLQEIETVKRSRGESEYEIARTRFNQYGPLMRLGRLSEAQAMLEGCLQVFRDANELTTQSTTLSALANIWKERGDLTRAIDLERQALSVKERMDDSEIRAISHGNLSSYLYKDGQTEESANHTLARIIYNVVTGNQQLLGTVLRNLSICMKQNAQYRLPRLSTLLSNPQFTTLRRFLEQRNIVDEGELQEGIDGILSELGL